MAVHIRIPEMDNDVSTLSQKPQVSTAMQTARTPAIRILLCRTFDQSPMKSHQTWSVASPPSSPLIIRCQVSATASTVMFSLRIFVVFMICIPQDLSLIALGNRRSTSPRALRNPSRNPPLNCWAFSWMPTTKARDVLSSEGSDASFFSADNVPAFGRWMGVTSEQSLWARYREDTGPNMVAMDNENAKTHPVASLRYH